MASNTRDLHDPSAIDAILRGLTDRPNVQSTLILSRKDGSIIKATGAIATPGAGSMPEQRYTGLVGTDESGAAQPNITAATPTKEEGLALPSQPRSVSQAEVLASLIYNFVAAATALGAAMASSDNIQGVVHDPTGRDPSVRQPSLADQHDPVTHGDQEVQLLRMRTKKQEVIIFPDPKYLCCVVQNVGKAGQERTR